MSPTPLNFGTLHVCPLPSTQAKKSEIYTVFIVQLLFLSSPLQFRTEQDKKNVCFICSLASHEFERRASGFESHVKHDHNMWRYIYLSIYLDQIDISDHNAIQKFVYDMVSATVCVVCSLHYRGFPTTELNNYLPLPRKVLM